jgi:hypothetical protein
MSCFVCTRGDLLSGDVARVLDLGPLEAPFVDRIIFASIVASAVTVWGEDLLPRVPVPSVRRFDILKAMFALSSQVVLSAATFPALPDATKYAMGALKHSLHSCFFCYHRRTATTDEEIDFFQRRLGQSSVGDLLTLRCHTGGRLHLSSDACRHPALHCDRSGQPVSCDVVRSGLSRSSARREAPALPRGRPAAEARLCSTRQGIAIERGIP